MSALLSLLWDLEVWQSHQPQKILLLISLDHWLFLQIALLKWAIGSKHPVVEGNIEEIGIRSIKVRTFAQALVSVPNATIANTPITNWSRMGKRRVKTHLGLTYNTSIEQLKTILEDIRAMLAAHPDVHKETIIVNFDEFEEQFTEHLPLFFHQYHCDKRVFAGQRRCEF